ncbi:glycoside hydrolase family 3 C-terminal domain-containing protein [Pseudarthrobacter sp. NPDC058329]|uniref:glycoside hydrolase family 3 C-terminal domain-containing protein n=1 Tax=Pseudarthrobacter sp. NPDC058329 TaxID=3346448 RepID=UPI0036D81BC3
MTPTEVGTLTLQEKASLLSGAGMWTTKSLPAHGIPEVVLNDGPHGLRHQTDQTDHLGIYDSTPATCFPPAVSVGSSWDPDIAAHIGAAIGREARALGVAVVLGPGVNIKRSPLCGRNFEYFSEDPLLSGVLATSYVQALQRQGVGTSLKHFAANNQETWRLYVSAEVDERTLREIYLPAFERVVTEAKPATVMCAYNKINGVFASENHWLLTEVLREEWGFEGAVVSDWGAVHNRVAGVRAGLDLEMPGVDGQTDAEVVAAVQAGELDEALVDASVRRLLSLTELHREPSGEIDVDGHHALVRKLAADGIVLLKNDDEVLPLRGGQKVAVIGSFAEELRFQGGGSSHINAARIDSPADELRTLATTVGATVDVAPGFSMQASDSLAAVLREEAVSLAATADVAVVFAGLNEADESESFDRKSIALPREQVDVIRAVAAANPRTVVVLSNGGVVSLEGWHDEVSAVLEGWLLGQAGGGALADVLFGVTNPSGHLAETIPLRLEDNPSFLNYPGEQGTVRYGEGVMVGYRYYTTVGAPVRYPFGHGLSYTTFTTTDLEVEVTGNEAARVALTVTNTGDRFGKHVVQVYVATEAGPVRRPIRELRAFKKVALEPGASVRVELELDSLAFAFWDITAKRRVVEPGTYTVQIGQNAAKILAETSIKLNGEKVSRPLTLNSTMGEWLDHPAAGPIVAQRISEMVADSGQSGAAGSDPDAFERLRVVTLREFATYANLPQEAREELMGLGGEPSRI